MFEIADLIEILNSDDCYADLKELSVWASNIKQEAPILHILAKLLVRNGYRVTLEVKTRSNEGKRIKSDMRINDSILEAKFCYEEDIFQKIRLLYEKVNHNYEQILDWLNQKIENDERFYFQLTWGILKDIFFKNPDIFMLICLSRDLSETSELELENINWTNNCLKYNKKRKYNHPDTLKILTDLLRFIIHIKPCKYYVIEKDVNIYFPSTYHFHILDFRDSP